MAVTEWDVLAIMHNGLETSEVTPFLITAKLIRAEDLAGTSYSEDRKDQIEIWLAAHLTAMGKDHSGRIASEDLERTYMSRYGGEFGLALNHTRYGQVVLQLDPEGALTQPEEEGVRLPGILEVVGAGSL